MIRKDISFLRNGCSLNCELLLPEEGAGPFPVVILSHGFNGCSEHSIPYAERFLAHGIAAVIFDFIGGAMESRSGGRMEDMSVKTEQEDLLAVMEKVRSLPELDGKKLFLLGRSQGGLVSAMAAAARGDQVRGLILLYPAFSIPGDLRKMYPDPEMVPQRQEFLGAVVGRIYYDDIVSLDVEKIQRSFRGPVLIIQGQKDTTVRPETAEIAAGCYENCRLVRLPEAGHGFSGGDFEKAAEESVRTVLESM
jgi:pimeloyl-ACP methyl ester carboxylesterase